ncbi:beta subunit of fatty acid synthetase [Periplaneta americana]|uniref:Beta subunit of fatty acid synthetase n=1 Tax=Periplaneta americana TaxID=6978 RepID=A0ABQ8TV51_PERAM|nr:beta subunit of fatty acid synthetase [Periplaneta americana]
MRITVPPSTVHSGAALESLLCAGKFKNKSFSQTLIVVQTFNFSNTFHLGQQDNFNEELGDKTKRFTYFVPRDYAWKKAEIHFPSAHKKLFMKEYSYHVRQILERHLVVAERAFTMADLKQLANDTIVLPTVRDHLKLRIKESEKSYFVEWQGEWIHVFRPDVECTNGIIHVIDSVFLKESDVRVTSNPSVPLIAPHLTIVLSWPCCSPSSGCSSSEDPVSSLT